MLYPNEIEIPLSVKMRNKIREYAHHGGGINRLNTAGANYYSFTPFKNEKGKEDFCGGWDWRSTIPNNFSYVYDMSKGRFLEMDKIERLKELGQL